MDQSALPATFFARDTLTVARDLLGRTVWRWDAARGAFGIYRIVETEGYTPEDPACHAYRNPTGRAKIMFGAPGRAYVYIIYGMYHCLNVVTEPEGRCAAVLIRALEPLVVPGDGPMPDTKGPGKLCRALGITKTEHNGWDLTQPNANLYLGEAQSLPMTHEVIETTRIGLSVAQDVLWRYCIAGNPWVSVKPKILTPSPAQVVSYPAE